MPFDLTIVTPEGQAFHGSADSVVLPGCEGDFGVLPGHEVFLTALRVGAARIETEGRTLYAALGGSDHVRPHDSPASGFAEIHGDIVTVMVDSCEFAHEIDVERAKLARERAQRMLEEVRGTPEGEELYQQYQDAYSRAITRLETAEKYRT